jgi:hypothetical protein
VFMHIDLSLFLEDHQLVWIPLESQRSSSTGRASHSELHVDSPSKVMKHYAQNEAHFILRAHSTADTMQM